MRKRAHEKELDCLHGIVAVLLYCKKDSGILWRNNVQYKNHHEKTIY